MYIFPVKCGKSKIVDHPKWHHRHHLHRGDHPKGILRDRRGGDPVPSPGLAWGFTLRDGEWERFGADVYNSRA